MATHDYIISNASGAAVRADLNNALAAIATNNSSATEPTTTYAYQWWADTGSSPTVMKLRNAANSAWITLFQLDGEWSNIAFENGSAAAPSIYFKDSGTDTGFYSPGTNQVGISTGGTSALVVDSSQRAGIGNTTPSSYATGYNDLVVGNHTGNHGITIASQNTATGRIEFADGTGATEVDVGEILYNHANNSLTISTNRSTALTVDSSQRLLVGTTTALGTNNLVTLKGTASSNASIFFGRNGNASGIIAGNSIGFLEFGSGDGGIGAQIKGEADGTWSSTADCPSRLIFSTTADGAPSPTERMGIYSNGSTGIFTTAANSIFLDNSSTAGTSQRLILGRYGATGLGSGTTSFNVFTNGNVTNTNNSYTGISDIKLKENIVDSSSQWADLKALQVRKYNFKEGQTHTQIGLVAQEVEQVSPGLVFEIPDRDEDGNETGEVTKSVNYSVLYMKAVKALQEAMERIEALERRLTDAGIA